MKSLSIAVEPSQLRSAFGVDDASVASRLLSQVVNALHSGTRDVPPEDISAILNLVEGIAPTNALEAMTAGLLVTTQHAAMEMMRKALHPDQTPEGRAMYLPLAMKASRTFAELLDTYNRGRGKGVARQEIVVQHVTVEAGAQAIVAPVTRGRG